MIAWWLLGAQPGLPSSYFVEYRTIRQLLGEAQRRQGVRFDRQRFHERLLRAGFVPHHQLIDEFLDDR